MDGARYEPSRRARRDGWPRALTVAVGRLRFSMRPCRSGRVARADWLPGARPAQARGGANRQPEARDRVGAEGGGVAVRSAGVGLYFRQHGSFRTLKPRPMALPTRGV